MNRAKEMLGAGVGVISVVIPVHLFPFAFLHNVGEVGYQY